MANVATIPTEGQILVNIEDMSMLKDIKKAISLLKGVASVKVKRTTKKEYDITKTAGYREAMDYVKNGRVTTYDSVEDLFQKLGINV